MGGAPVPTDVDAAFAEMWQRLSDGQLNLAARSVTRILALTDDLVLVARAEAALGTMFQRVGQLADSRDRYRRAAEATPDEAARATYLALASTSLLFGGEPGPAERHALDGVELGRRVDNSHAVCEGLNALAGVRLAQGRPQEGLGLAQESLTLAGVESRSRGGRPMPRLFLATALIELDRHEDADRELSRGLSDAATRSRPEVESAWLLTFRSLGRFIAGRWDDALVDARAAIAHAETSGTLVVLPLVRACAAIVEHFRGNQSAAAQLVADAGPHRIGAFGTFGGDWLVFAQSLATPDPDEAYATMLEAWHYSRQLPWLLSWRLVGPAVVRAALDRGDRPVAQAVAAEVAVGARLAGAVPSAVAADLRCRGLLAGDAEQLGEAAQRYADSGRPLNTGYAALDAALAWQAEGRADLARPHLLRAHDCFTVLRATSSQALVGRLLARDAGAHPVAEPVADPFLALTPAERAVVERAARGLTNPEIAAELSLSARTVQSHLTHVYVKLGLTSRVQLAALARPSGLVRPD